MRYKTCALTVLIAGLCTAVWAGDIEGKVTGMKGQSVVYVDAIAGKTFPAPKEHPVVDQKGLLFAPHIIAVQQGTTVEFLNSDNVQHNVFWPSSRPATRKQDTISARGPKVKSVPLRSIRRALCPCSAMCTRKWRDTSSSAQLPTLPKPTIAAITRSKTFRTAAIP
jgi:plastocyanin